VVRPGEFLCDGIGHIRRGRAAAEVGHARGLPSNSTHGHFLRRHRHRPGRHFGAEGKGANYRRHRSLGTALKVAAVEQSVVVSAQALTPETESGEMCSQIYTASMSETPVPMLFRAKPWITATLK
jgi:hypothetical protein